MCDTGHATGKVDTILFWTVKDRHTVAVAAMAMMPLSRGSFVRFPSSVESM